MRAASILKLFCRSLCVGAALGCAPAIASDAANAAVRGVFGVTVSVTADGLFNPTVRVARITRVEPGLPAARAGVLAGDEVIEVDHRRIPGARAADLAPLAQGKRVGDEVMLVLARSDGSHYKVRLTAVPSAR
jgi:S1-C subfamily serine protease